MTLEEFEKYTPTKYEDGVYDCVVDTLEGQCVRNYILQVTGFDLNFWTKKCNRFPLDEFKDKIVRYPSSKIAEKDFEMLDYIYTYVKHSFSYFDSDTPSCRSNIPPDEDDLFPFSF